MSQQISLLGRTLRMVRAGTAVTVGERLGEGGQGVVHSVTIGGAAYAVKWYRYAPSGELRKSIAALVERGRPHRDFIWPIDLVVSEELSGFGYVMPRLDPQFSSFAQLVSRSDQPPFRVVSTIGRHLVTAFEALHSAGLCYRDISFGNLWVDADASEVAIIDNDNVGLDGGEVFVWGTLRFMAPEVVRREAPPSSLTDLHSLAVFLFYLFMHGHPLEGVKTDESYSWADSSHRSETDLALRHFGTEPVFIFDPDDHSNPPRPGDPVSVWWRLYPRFFRTVFERAFTAGLRDPSGLGRVTEGVWRRALVRLADCVSVCSCQASVFYDPDDPGLRCWNCNQVPPKPKLIELPGGTIALSQGAVITPHHLSRNRDHDTMIAVVENHPARPGDLVLRNVSTKAWTMTPVGESPKTVDPQRRLGIRPMTIDFVSAHGRIVT
ncbi:MAG: protein kinase domain-containing protein [Streptosporangiaceae bacterium]